MQDVKSLLAELSQAGGRAWLEGDNIRARFPSALSQSMKAEFSRRKEEIVAYLRENRGSHLRLPRFQPRSRPDKLPLTLSQRMWFNTLVPDMHLHEQRRTPAAWRLSGHVDSDLMRLAAQSVVQRHEILRTRFHRQGEESWQIIAADEPDVTVSVDLTQMPPFLRERRAGEIWRKYHNAPADYTSDSPLRVYLFKVADSDYILCASLLHAAVDNRSISVFITELFGSYLHLVEGLKLPPDSHVQYADYALWETSWCTPELEARNYSKWLKATQVAPALELRRRPAPADAPLMSPVMSRPVAFTSDHYATAIEVAKAHQTTVAIVVEAVLGLLLGAWSRQKSFYVQLVADGRPPSFGGTLGCFVRTAPLIYDLRDCATFANLVEQLKPAHRQATSLVDATNPIQLPGYNRVILNLYQDATVSPAPVRSAEGASKPAPFTIQRWQPFPPLMTYTSADLRVIIRVRKEQVRAHVLYASDRLDSEEVDRFAEQFSALLEGLNQLTKRDLQETLTELSATLRH